MPLPTLSKIPLYLNAIFFIIALIGFVDASYLTVSHYSGADLACGSYGGCNVVTTSEYSTIGPIPVALLGALYYLAIIILSVLYFDKKQSGVAVLRSWFTVVGLVASAIFVYLQLVVIKQICLYCMVSATTSTLLFILGMYILKKYQVPNNSEKESA